MTPLPEQQLLARTQIAVNTGAYSTERDSVQLTGRTRRQLHARAEDGVLPSRKTGAQTRVYDTQAVMRDAYRSGRLLLPDVLRTASGTRLNETDFAHALTTHHCGTWYTLSRRDRMPPDWRSWAAWYRGAQDEARTWLREEARQHHAVVESLTARGLTQRTLWCADSTDHPSTDYSRYQAARYETLAGAGAHIRVLPVRKLSYIEFQGAFPDLEILPDAVYVRQHTAVGGRDGATRITDPGLVAAAQELARWLYTSHAIMLRGTASLYRVPV